MSQWKKRNKIILLIMIKHLQVDMLDAKLLKLLRVKVFGEKTHIFNQIMHGIAWYQYKCAEVKSPVKPSIWRKHKVFT